MSRPIGHFEAQRPGKNTSKTAVGNHQCVISDQRSLETPKAAIDEVVDALNTGVIEGPELPLDRLIFKNPKRAFPEVCVDRDLQAQPFGDRHCRLANPLKIAGGNRNWFGLRQDACRLFSLRNP